MPRAQTRGRPVLCTGCTGRWGGTLWMPRCPDPTRSMKVVTPVPLLSVMRMMHQTWNLMVMVATRLLGAKSPSLMMMCQTLLHATLRKSRLIINCMQNLLVKATRRVRDAMNRIQNNAGLGDQTRPRLPACHGDPRFPAMATRRTDLVFNGVMHRVRGMVAMATREADQVPKLETSDRATLIRADFINTIRGTIT